MNQCQKKSLWSRSPLWLNEYSVNLRLKTLCLRVFVANKIRVCFVLDFELGSFEFVLDFEIRDSDFLWLHIHPFTSYEYRVSSIEHLFPFVPFVSICVNSWLIIISENPRNPRLNYSCHFRVYSWFNFFLSFLCGLCVLCG